MNEFCLLGLVVLKYFKIFVIKSESLKTNYEINVEVKLRQRDENYCTITIKCLNFKRTWYCRFKSLKQKFRNF